MTQVPQVKSESEVTDELEKFYQEVKKCQRCPLARCRTNLVFGSGNHRAELMFVGEAPGYHEDQEGEPFVGAAGKLLCKLLEGIGRNRRDVYIANVLKCRPPQNREPYPDEIEMCKPYLFRQIELIKPRIVCTLGNFATQTVLGKRVSITTVRAQRFQAGDYFVFPIFHPAAALHRGDMLEPLEQDFKKLKELLDSDIMPVREPEQMDLF